MAGSTSNSSGGGGFSFNFVVPTSPSDVIRTEEEEHDNDEATSNVIIIPETDIPKVENHLDNTVITSNCNSITEGIQGISFQEQEHQRQLNRAPPSTQNEQNDSSNAVIISNNTKSSSGGGSGGGSKSSCRIPFVWIRDWNELYLERVREDMVYTEIPFKNNNNNKNNMRSLPSTSSNKNKNDDDDDDDDDSTIIRCVDLNATSFRRESDAWKDEEEDGGGSSSKKLDLISGIYEGGNKVWECSLDLVEYLATNNIRIKQDTTCLEIGCGHALPSCYLLRQALLSSVSDFTMVVTDYNDYVLTDATLSNVALNTAGTGTTPETIVQKEYILAGAGDWIDMSEQLLLSQQQQQQREEELNSTESNTSSRNSNSVPVLYDYILASETLYTVSACYETALLLFRHLKPHGAGIGYVASKRYYFGVGGGTDCFLQYCIAPEFQLHVTTVQVYDNGTGNIREILRITKK